MMLIILSFITAIFCYTFIPDRTPFSNRMNLLISNQSPGFTVQMLKVPSREIFDDTGKLEALVNGLPDKYDYVPIDSFHAKNGRLFYTEFSGEKKPSEFFKSVAVDNQNTLSNQIVSRTFLFGTDRYGRDLFSRIVAGTRVTLSVGLIAVIISLVVGIFFGAIAGFFKGITDQFVLWLINVIWSVPTLILVIAITLVLGKGFEQVFIAVGLTMWVDVARMVRGQLLSVRELEFVSAAKAMGFSNTRIIRKHLLTNIIGPVLVVAASNFSTAILLEAGLSFLGIGAQPPTPSWGSMIKENYGYIIIPGSAYLAILPGLAIMLLTMAFTFVANGLRDAMDSKQQINLA